MITKINIQNFKGISNLAIDIPKDTKFIFVTGDNGSGKTTFLQAIKVGLLQNTMQRVDDYISKDCLIKIDASVLTYLAWDIQKSDIKEGSMAELIDSFCIRDFCNFDSLLITFNLLPNKEKYFGLIKEIIRNVLEVNDIVLDDNNCALYDNVAAFDLRIPQACILNIFINIIAGFTNDFNTQIDSLNNLKGIVILDNVDCGLHPKMQRFLIEKFTELFPKVQFVISTNSPIPLLGAPKETIIIKTSNSKDGITAEILDINFHGFMPNLLLTSPIFGFRNIAPKYASKKAILRTEYVYDELLLNDEVARRLDQRKDDYESVFDFEDFEN